MNSSRKKKRKLKKGALAVLIVLAVLFLILCLGLFLFLFVGSVLDRMEKTETMTQTEAEVAPEVIELETEGDVFNFLLFGADENEYEEGDAAMERADATKIISLDKRNKTISIASLQRDTMVWIPGPVNDYSKLNHAYWWGGAPLAIRTVNMNFDMNITKYVTFSMTGVEKVVDAVGGVDIYLNAAESEYFNNGFIKETNCVPGTYHLNGKEAMSYARLREIDNDYNRMSRQNVVISAVVSKLSECSVPEMVRIAASVMPYIETNFTNMEIELWLSRIVSYDRGNIRTQDVPMTDRAEIYKYIEYNGYSPCYILEDYGKVVQDLYEFLFGIKDYKVSQQAQKIHSDLIGKFAPELK